MVPGCSWCHPGMCQANTVVCEKDSDIFWNSPGGGSWTESSNWDLGRIPADGDTVYVSLSGRYDVAVDIAVNVKNLILGGVCRSGFCSSKPRLLVGRDLTTKGLLINQGAELYVYNRRTLIVDGQALNNGVLRVGGPTCQFNQGVGNYGAIIIQDSGATLTGNITNHGFFDFNPAYGHLYINNVLHNKASGTVGLGSTSYRIYRGHVLNEGAITMDCGCSEEVQCSCSHYIGCSLVNFGMISIRSGTADFYEDVQLSGTLELHSNWIVFRSTSTILESATTVHSETGSVEFYGGSHNLESADVHIGNWLVSNTAVLNVNATNVFGSLKLYHGTIHVLAAEVDIDALYLNRGSLRGYDNVIKVQRLDIFTHNSQDPSLYSVTIEVEKTLKQSNDIYLNSDSKIVLEEGCQMVLPPTEVWHWYRGDSSSCLFKHQGEIIISGSLTINVEFESTGKVDLASYGVMTLAWNAHFVSGGLLVHQGGTLSFSHQNAEYNIETPVHVSFLGTLSLQGQTSISSQDIGTVGYLSVLGQSSEVVIDVQSTEELNIGTLQVQEGTLRINKPEGSVIIDFLYDSYGNSHLHLNANCMINKFSSSQSHSNSWYYFNASFSYTFSGQTQLSSSHRYLRLLKTGDTIPVINIYGDVLIRTNLHLVLDSVAVHQHGKFTSASTDIHLKNGAIYTIETGGQFVAVDTELHNALVYNYGTMEGNSLTLRSGGTLINYGELHIYGGKSVISNLENFGALLIEDGGRFDADVTSGSHVHAPGSAVISEPG